MSKEFDLSSVILPIIELFISMLSDIMRSGYDNLSDAKKLELNSWMPTAYILFLTKGAELVESSETSLDDSGLKELIEFMEKLEADGIVALPHFQE